MSAVGFACREREPERPREADRRPISNDRDRERMREKERDVRWASLISLCPVSCLK